MSEILPAAGFSETYHWYPGHMTKTRRAMEAKIGGVDAVAELLDARIPSSSRNRLLDKIAAGKPRLLVFTHTDLADPAMTTRWEEYYRSRGFGVIVVDSKSGKGVNRFMPEVSSLLRDKLDRFAEKGQNGRKLTCMVMGIPNVGKSSFINRVSGRKATKTEDRPGVTRDLQLISMDGNINLLDTPGMLMPKIESDRQGFLLAATGAIKDEVVDAETLAAHLLNELLRAAPEAVIARYKLRKEDIDSAEGNIYTLLETASRRRGFLISGGEGDTERFSRILLDEFRGGKLGRLTLERPEDEK